MAKHGIATRDTVSVPAKTRQYLDRDGNAIWQQSSYQLMTSWDTLYWQLKSAFCRRQLLPGVVPDYAGYVAWRGVVDECEVSPAVASVFVDKFTFFQAPHTHILCYLIPGLTKSYLQASAASTGCGIGMSQRVLCNGC